MYKKPERWTFETVVAILLLVFICCTPIIVTCIIVDTVASASEISIDSIDTDIESETSSSIADNQPLEEKYRSIFEWQVYTGDFENEQLYYLNDMCKKYEIPLELMLSLICAESSFNSDSISSISSAAGYCQIIKGTAKWLYEDKLKYGDYDVNNHTEIMTTNWKLNIELGCRYIYLLYWSGDHTWATAIKRYHGSTDESENIAYLNRVNTRMQELFNMSINDL